MKKVKTSEIVIRPFQSMSEPVAVLKYGNIEIQMEYTMMYHLTLDWNSPRIAGVTNSAFKEILLEMQANMDGKVPHGHRDSKETDYWIKNRNHMYSLSPDMGEILDCEFTNRYPDRRKYIDECPYGHGKRSEDARIREENRKNSED